MPFNTFTVATAVTPQVVATYISHYLNRKPLRQKPTAHISYHEGLHLIRQFLYYASHHTVEDIQAFTSQWVPYPLWVRVEDVKIPEEHISASANAIISQLGPGGQKQVGGKVWWQWRPPTSELKAEWIEMRGDYNARKRRNENDNGNRVMLYVHGGAYFFGSVDEHRYQLQRHARKLKAKVLAPRYRLAPQFPFPCGLHDCLAAYLYLLSIHAPSEIVLAGDSAGGGMVVSMLVTLRDQGISLPAGAILISPWVDLTHSFPSVSGESMLDYIPAHGFMQRPSLSWPPPNAKELQAILKGDSKQAAKHDPKEKNVASDATLPSITETQASSQHAAPTKTISSPGHTLSIEIDGRLVEIGDQIQMYASNHLLSHPLVSPVLQPSLGGLPPMLILTGGGEMLRDEQIYLAHKAANPSEYSPSASIMDLYDPERTLVDRYPPTDVQLQVWDDLCHVAPTLSFTRPAKYMYRSIAQFGAWTLARAQKTEIEILDDDEVSIISSGSSTDSDELSDPKVILTDSSGQIGKAGDPLPNFRSHMIRQRVDRHGIIYPLPSASTLPACQVTPDEVGTIKPGPVRKWMAAKKKWDVKYASQRQKVQNRRAKDCAIGYEKFDGEESPPPSALAGRRRKGKDYEMRPRRIRKSVGMSLWSLWGSKHDKSTIVREEIADSNPEVPVITTTTVADSTGRTRSVTAPSHLPTSGVAATRPRGFSLSKSSRPVSGSRSKSRRRVVMDIGQTDGPTDLDIEPGHSLDGVTFRDRSQTEPGSASQPSPSYISSLSRNKRLDLGTEISSLSTNRSAQRNPSTLAVVEASGICTPLTASSAGDFTSDFESAIAAVGLGTNQNPSAVAVVQHDGVCDDLRAKNEKGFSHDVRYDPIGSGRANLSTMAVTENQNIKGIGGGEKSENASTVGTHMDVDSAKNDHPSSAAANDDEINFVDSDIEDTPKAKKKGSKLDRLTGSTQSGNRNNSPSSQAKEDDLFDVMASIAAANGRGKMQDQSFDAKRAKGPLRREDVSKRGPRAKAKPKDDESGDASGETERPGLGERYQTAREE